MHRLYIRAIGSAHEDWHPQAIHSYLKRLGPFAKIEISELKEGHGGSAKPDENKTKMIEAEQLLKAIPDGSTVVVLDETGKNLASMEFASKLDDWTQGGRAIVFLIGGSWGLDKSVRQRADFVLSLGRQTLPHLLARITLLEQLYRAETILAHKTYHK
ncbi:23S rRNA (pseudouridine(1915)-N(3))-methyltransferase RlmH [Candidatus Uhrbacteria bacterium]|nr:23S rRNA (pseudouridine(1915)-N(3))-methyltransferase RlmH [Candidatus Uhrbacteria bacterium]